jgi:hypothetical protein
MSAQTVPLPKKPSLHVHVKLPAVLVHDASDSHELAPAHSSLSTHTVPLPEKPTSHAHWNDDTVFVHSALLEHVTVAVAHSSISVHETLPLPVKPRSQTQLVELAAQESQLKPSPLNPAVHWHECEPGGSLMHAALMSHVSVPAVHSLISVHTVPLPLTSAYPLKQSQTNGGDDSDAKSVHVEFRLQPGADITYADARDSDSVQLLPVQLPPSHSNRGQPKSTTPVWHAALLPN